MEVVTGMMFGQWFVPLLMMLLYVGVVVYAFILLHRIATGVERISRAVESLATRPDRIVGE